MAFQGEVGFVRSTKGKKKGGKPKPSGGLILNVGGGGGGGGGSSGGGGSGGGGVSRSGGGGGGVPGVTSVGGSRSIARGMVGRGGGGPSEAEQRQEQMKQAGESLYFQLWGQPAPVGYIEGLTKRGMNLFEIELHERRKPAFRQTRAWEQEATDHVANLLRFFGVAV